MEKLPDSSLIVGVATSTAERVQLARLLSEADALLLVSSADQARAFLDLTATPDTAPVVLTPGVLAPGELSPVDQPDPDLPGPAQIEATPPRSGPNLVTTRAIPATSTTHPHAAARTAPVATRTPAAGTPTAQGGADVVALPTGLRLDQDRRVVRWQDREVPLTRLEHDFLHCLVQKPGQVWTYQRLHHAVWGNEHLGHGSHIHSVVKRLRQKLADLGAAVTIHAVRGVGFHLLPAA
ncbi:transcriptional regulator [Kribbella sp. VKM Ac-2527]|uniref:Transcriptional regulator n=1 Tax=Kribbella caucasensis TaxID=2512215 RepID=A0A4R6KMU2_9ACTN|nr:winged helix-turn-helix domain-containing protein [Kribbella sp. VKM Ac-2527]TDO52591.1 transcriptional regulator [Kribbella sp. VKM Ac-2527]